MHVSNSKLKVSIIIPTYNRSQLLDYSLASLVQQDIDKRDFEVIVADDGSSDDTKEVLRRYEDKMNTRYVYQPDKGYRPASARNMGIRVAEGHICLFMDSGVMLNSDCVRQHIDFYARMNDNVAVVGYIYGFQRTKDSEIKLKELIDISNVADSISKISKNPLFFDVREVHYVNYNYQIHDLPASWLYFWTCHVSATRYQLLSAGLFDENYDGRWGGEDNDIAIRLVQQGVKLHLLRSAEAIHYPHDKDAEGRQSEGYQNCKYLNDKYGTLETQLLFDHYLDETNFVDINKLSIEIRGNNESITNLTDVSVVKQ